MSVVETDVRETEAERVERWRAEELERAGFDACSAAQLAARSDVDLHKAIATALSLR